MTAHQHVGASVPGPVTPRSDNARLQPGVEGDQGTADGPDCAALDDDRKAVITMMAHAAQAGCTLHELASGGYLLCRWGMAKELPCLRAVGDLLRRIGGAR